jgi:hypothetical protein
MRRTLLLAGIVLATIAGLSVAADSAQAQYYQDPGYNTGRYYERTPQAGRYYSQRPTFDSQGRYTQRGVTETEAGRVQSSKTIDPRTGNEISTTYYRDPYTGKITTSKRIVDPRTGRETASTRTTDPYSGTVQRSRVGQDPYSGRYSERTSGVDPYSGRAYRSGSTYDPYYGRSSSSFDPYYGRSVVTPGGIYIPR